MFRTTLTVLWIFLTMAGFAQKKGKPAIEFQSLSHDFGIVKEETAKVSYEFVFKNTGNAPLVIQQVKTSCGCTTPSWTKRPVVPGATGKITVIYATFGHSGHFAKTITVTTNTGEAPLQLTIHGIVTSQPLSANQAFPVNFGNIRLKSSVIFLGKITKGETKSLLIPFINSSKKAVTVTLSQLPPHITISGQPVTVAPGKEASIRIVYHSSLVNDWAFHNDPVLLVIEDNVSTSQRKRLMITSFLSENFAPLTPAQREVIPIAVIPQKDIKLGKTKTGSKIAGSIAITNNGKSPLLIRKAFSDCNCITFRVPGKGIAPGKTIALHFMVNTGNAAGWKMENVNLITNSPTTTDLQFQLQWQSNL
jgi:hypothetical protein